MPQLDTSTFTSQLFWLVVCFFSMMFIMSKFIIPKIADIMNSGSVKSTVISTRRPTLRNKPKPLCGNIKMLWPPPLKKPTSRWPTPKTK